MTITAADTPSLMPAERFILPPSNDLPLAAALDNCNHAWKWYRPPLISVAPEQGTAGRLTLAIPILPSADGLPYTFEVRLITVATTTVPLTVRYCTSYTGLSTTWTTLYTATPSTTAGVLLERVDTNKVLPADAVAVQVDVEAASGNLTLHHVLAYPAPTSAPSAGVYDSGFVPWDNGYLQGEAADGAPLHTEYFNRVGANVRALLTDRWRCLASFVQSEGNSPAHTATGPDAGGPTWFGLPPAFVSVPWASDKITVRVLCIASVDAGSSTEMVRVANLNQASVALDADRTIQSADLEVQLGGKGTLRAAILNPWVLATFTNTTRLHALVVLWRPDLGV